MKNVQRYALAFAVLVTVSYFGRTLMEKFNDKDKEQEYELIRKYLLNDSPLIGYKSKPKMWIHTTYEHNSREWKSFYSRGSYDLNQPYLHLTIKSIINHCGDDFHICLIDDESFSRLIPNWNYDMRNLPEPFRARMRQQALATLVYLYGGMVVPNSLVCKRNLRDLYLEGTNGGTRGFVTEAVNRAVDLQSSSSRKKLLFVPDLYLMGAPRNDETMLELVEYLKQRNSNPHFQTETEFLGDSSRWCLAAIEAGKLNLVHGEMIGVKTADRRTIMLEDLMEEDYLNVDPRLYGVYIPQDEILRRNKYQWFASYPAEELLKTRLIVVKYLAASMVDATQIQVEIASQVGGV